MRRKAAMTAHLFELDGKIIEVAEGDVIPGLSRGSGPSPSPEPYRVAMATKVPGKGYSLCWLIGGPGFCSSEGAGFGKRRREAVRWLRRVAHEQVH